MSPSPYVPPKASELARESRPKGRPFGHIAMALFVINLMIFLSVAGFGIFRAQVTPAGPSAMASTLTTVLISLGLNLLVWITSVALGIRGLRSHGRDRSFAVLSLGCNIGALLVGGSFLVLALLVA